MTEPYPLNSIQPPPDITDYLGQGEIALHLLARGTSEQYGKRRILYEGKPQRLFMVIEGIARVFRVHRDGRQTHVDFIAVEGIFGEACLTPYLGSTEERVEAYTDLKVMSWSPRSVEMQCAEKPEILGALARVFARKAERYFCRLREMGSMPIDARLGCTLLRLAEQIGTKYQGGYVIVPPVVHEVLKTMMGTSREVISMYMGRLEKSGLIQYNRKGIRVYPVELLKWVQQER